MQAFLFVHLAVVHHIIYVQIRLDSWWIFALIFAKRLLQFGLFHVRVGFGTGVRDLDRPLVQHLLPFNFSSSRGHAFLLGWLSRTRDRLHFLYLRIRQLLLDCVLSDRSVDAEEDNITMRRSLRLQMARFVRSLSH